MTHADCRDEPWPFSPRRATSESGTSECALKTAGEETVGLFKNVKSAWELKVALTPLATATTELDFRAHLPKAQAASEKIWPLGTRRLIRSGSAKDRLLSAAAAPLAAQQLLDKGQFPLARQVIVEAINGLDQLYG
jgi:hypothetical protein